MKVEWLIGGLCCGLPVVLVGGVLAFLKIDRWLRTHNYRPLQSWRVRAGRGHTVEELAKRLQMREPELRTFQPRYGRREIRKRSGGTRVLWIPDPGTKALQRRILRLLLAGLNVHPACHGFERGKSIATNAALHVGKRVLIKLDIRDFFSRTTAARVEEYFRRIGWGKDAAGLLTRLTTHEGGLPQGAPTSPRLSNLVNYVLDARLARLAQRRRITYTRYADDITFSCRKDYPRRVRGVVMQTASHLKSLGYQLNRRKIIIARPHQQQRVTGIVVNEKLNLPRKTRRLLRAVAYRLATGEAATLTPRQLEGYLAYQKMVMRGRSSDGPTEPDGH